MSEVGGRADSVIFGKWSPGSTLTCLLFGAATAVQFQVPPTGIAVPNALLIMMSYLLALLAVAGLSDAKSRRAALAEPCRRS
jgi:general nucleoside transport system permease protein